MISAHKIQEHLASIASSYRPLPWSYINKSESEVPLNQESHIIKASELLNDAVKFDLGELSQQNSRALFYTGIEYAKEGLLKLPFEPTYAEVTFVNDTINKRSGTVFAPTSMLFDEAVFEKHPEFVGGTAALSFSRINKTIKSNDFWGIHALIAVISPDCKEVYSVPMAKGLPEYAVLTETQRHDEAYCSITKLCIMHSLINARGVELQTEPAPTKLNRKRFQRNKPPLYEYHILKIGGYSSGGRVLGFGASHASPRAHWRRGHIRTIHEGTPKQKKIPIPATLINGPGFVSKDYEISR
jgi:hypothetical protein